MRFPPNLPLCFLIAISCFCLVNCKDNGPSLEFDEATAVYRNFDGDKTFGYLEKIVGFGPRVSGTEELKKSREYIVSKLAEFGWGVQLKEFELSTPIGNVQFCNIRARYSPSQDATVWDKSVSGIIGSHYDTKKFSFSTPFVGANDGGSSTAALIEIARVLAEKPELADKIELVWFDGEEAFGKNITAKDGLYGSKVYASEMALLPVKKRPKWGILLDIIGDQDVKIEAYVMVDEPSLGERKKFNITHDFNELENKRRAIAAQLMAAARDLGHQRKFSVSPNYMTDDHVPVNNIAGIPMVDLIHFKPDYWHQPGDTLDKISPDSLQLVGQTTLLLIEKYLMAK